jgi:hypothetical protein
MRTQALLSLWTIWSSRSPPTGAALRVCEALTSSCALSGSRRQTRTCTSMQKTVTSDDRAASQEDRSCSRQMQS